MRSHPEESAAKDHVLRALLYERGSGEIDYLEPKS